MVINCCWSVSDEGDNRLTLSILDVVAVEVAAGPATADEEEQSSDLQSDPDPVQPQQTVDPSETSSPASISSPAAALRADRAAFLPLSPQDDQSLSLEVEVEAEAEADIEAEVQQEEEETLVTSMLAREAELLSAVVTDELDPDEDDQDDNTVVSLDRTDLYEMGESASLSAVLVVTTAGGTLVAATMDILLRACVRSASVAAAERVGRQGAETERRAGAG